MRLDPRNPEIEALWRGIAAAELRSVAVVASRPGEGSSTVAEALWRRAAASGRSALLVGLNLDRPGLGAGGVPGSIHGLGAGGAIGALRGLGAGGAAEEIQRLGNTGLAVLTGASDATLEAWRDPMRLREAVERWLEAHDTVVLDGAPLVARGAQALPGPAVAAAAEGTVLVVLAGRTPSASVREAREVLGKAGARLVGAVLNDRDNPSLLAELEREAGRLARLAPGVAQRLTDAFRRSTLLGMRV